MSLADTRARPAILLALGWLLLIAAWIGANPPFAGPDEQWHYLRAIGIAHGSLIGRRDLQARFGANARQIAWTRQAARTVEVPAGLAPPTAGCYVFEPSRPATCIDTQRPPRVRTRQATPVGTYQPLPYLFPAALMRLASSPAAALRLGRLASALLCAALLAVALALSWEGDPLSLIGLLLAVTPMVLFCAALLNGSSLEIDAAIAFVAALLRLRRGAGTAPWVVAGCTGILLALSRDASPLWLVLLAVPLIPFRLPRGRAPLLAAAAVLAAIAANRAWEAAYGANVQLGLANARGALGEALREWWHATTDLVGRFGYLEVRVPLGWTLTWFVLVALLIALALRAGDRRERARLAATTAAFAAVLPVAFWLVQYRHTGFDLQGRQLLPLVVAVPLIAGDIIWRRRATLPHSTGRWLFAGAALATASVQLAAWWTDARRSAVGTKGPLVFVARAHWSPQLGWGLWLALAAAGAFAVALAGVTAAATGRRVRNG